MSLAQITATFCDPYGFYLGVADMAQFTQFSYTLSTNVPGECVFSLNLDTLPATWLTDGNTVIVRRFPPGLQTDTYEGTYIIDTLDPAELEDGSSTITVAAIGLLQILSWREVRQVGINEVKILEITGTPTGGGGYFTLQFPAAGPVTGKINWPGGGPSYGAIQGALESLTTIGKGNVKVTRTGAVPNLLYTIEFQKKMGNKPITDSFTVDNHLTGGAIVDFIGTGATDGVASTMGGPADDVMKRLVRENFTSGDSYYTNSAVRNLVLQGMRLVVQDDRALGGAAVSQDNKNIFCLDALTAIMKDNLTRNNPPVFYDIVQTGFHEYNGGSYEFRTFIGQRGQDRTGTMTFSRSNGVLRSSSLHRSTRDMRSVIIAGGSGNGALRITRTATNQTLVDTNLWGYREGYLDAADLSDTNALQGRANTELWSKRPVKSSAITISQDGQYRYGQDYFFGDKVSVNTCRDTFVAWIAGVAVTVDQQGAETVAITLVDDWKVFNNV